MPWTAEPALKNLPGISLAESNILGSPAIPQTFLFHSIERAFAFWICMGKEVPASHIVGMIPGHTHERRIQLQGRAADLLAVFVDELRGRVPQIEEQLAHAVGPDWRRVCHPDAPEPVPTALCTEPSGAAANLSDSSCAPPVLDPSARRLTIAGATLTSLGAGALIGMGASLFGIHTRVNEIRELTVEKSNNGGSTPAMDAAVDALLEHPAVYGARMTGGGFGGCVIAMCERGAALEGWKVRPVGGARRLEV